MSERKNEKKVRLFYLLPYGITSRAAMILATKMPEVAFMEYSSEIPMQERCAIFDRAHFAANRQLERMLETGYIEDAHRKYGKSALDQFRMVRLTRAGLYLLTGTPDPDVEAARIHALGPVTDRKEKELNYSSSNVTQRMLCEQLYIADTNPDATQVEQAVLTDAFLESVYEGELTILAGDIALPKKVDLLPQGINGRQLYRDWRLSNICALFIANDYLTYLDRRPMETGWAINGIQNDSDFARKIEGQGSIDITTYMYHALNRWYREHPDSYRFMDPSRSLEGEGIENWRHTPAFYSASEIPGFLNEENSYGTITLTGAKNVLRHTLSGVAVGAKTAYVVYHTKPGKTPWSERVEKATANVVFKALCDAKQLTPADGETEISSALMVCPSINQFAKLFVDAKKYMSKKWRKIRRVGVPYDTVSIIPMNASGAMQLRGLMQMTPNEYEMFIIRNLIKKNSRFERTHENLYQLTFDNTPVLVAHNMDMQRLFWALEDYYAGEKFLVSCFPGQVKFIKKIMPDVQFI